MLTSLVFALLLHSPEALSVVVNYDDPQVIGMSQVHAVGGGQCEALVVYRADFSAAADETNAKKMRQGAQAPRYGVKQRGPCAPLVSWAATACVQKLNGFPSTEDNAAWRALLPADCAKDP